MAKICKFSQKTANSPTAKYELHAKMNFSRSRISNIWEDSCCRLQPAPLLCLVTLTSGSTVSINRTRFMVWPNIQRGVCPVSKHKTFQCKMSIFRQEMWWPRQAKHQFGHIEALHIWISNIPSEKNFIKAFKECKFYIVPPWVAVWCVYLDL